MKCIRQVKADVDECGLPCIVMLSCRCALTVLLQSYIPPYCSYIPCPSLERTLVAFVSWDLCELLIFRIYSCDTKDTTKREPFTAEERKIIWESPTLGGSRGGDSKITKKLENPSTQTLWKWNQEGWMYFPYSLSSLFVLVTLVHNTSPLSSLPRPPNWRTSFENLMQF